MKKTHEQVEQDLARLDQEIARRKEIGLSMSINEIAHRLAEAEGRTVRYVGVPQEGEDICDTCDGTGKVDCECEDPDPIECEDGREECLDCDGNGFVPIEEEE